MNRNRSRTGRSPDQGNVTENYMCLMGKDPGKDPNPKTYSGLRNQGSTCYLNTVLQILFMTDECRQAVMRLKETSGKTVSEQLKKLFENLERNVQAPDTRGITHSLRITDVYRQADASECFQKILSKVNPDISTIYEGTIKETVTCKKGHQLKNDSSPFTLIPLSFNNPSSRFPSVEDAWTNHFKTTNRTLYCNDCNRVTSAKFESKINECPQILVLHLDRLNFHSGRKNTCQVKIEPTCSVEGQNYELYAIANHYGSPRVGHYNAFIKPYGDESWWCFDDSHVSKMEEWEEEHLIRSDAADMLFYKKITLEEKDKITPEEVNCAQKQHTEERQQKPSSKSRPANEKEGTSNKKVISPDPSLGGERQLQAHGFFSRLWKSQSTDGPKEHAYQHQGVPSTNEKVALAAESLPAVVHQPPQYELNRALMNAFTCGVCKNIMDQPVIAICCLEIVGCKGCMQKQLQSSNKCIKCQRTCPLWPIIEVFGLQDLLGLIRQEIQEKN